MVSQIIENPKIWVVFDKMALDLGYICSYGAKKVSVSDVKIIWIEKSSIAQKVGQDLYLTRSVAIKCYAYHERISTWMRQFNSCREHQ